MGSAEREKRRSKGAKATSSSGKANGIGYSFQIVCAITRTSHRIRFPVSYAVSGTKVAAGRTRHVHSDVVPGTEMARGCTRQAH
eukprot:441495-Rhodomonas_salina.5